MTLYSIYDFQTWELLCKLYAYSVRDAERRAAEFGIAPRSGSSLDLIAFSEEAAEEVGLRAHQG